MTSSFGLALAGSLIIPALGDISDENQDWKVFVGSSALIGILCALV